MKLTEGGDRKTDKSLGSRELQNKGLLSKHDPANVFMDSLDLYLVAPSWVHEYFTMKQGRLRRPHSLQDY